MVLSHSCRPPGQTPCLEHPRVILMPRSPSSWVGPQLAAESPNMTAVALWIVPTLLVTLTLYSVLAGQLVEFQIADS